MKIKRFVASDMRSAIRMVRETLGPDAVILSNKSTDEGIELMAAMDFDPSAIEESPSQQGSRQETGYKEKSSSKSASQAEQLRRAVDARLSDKSTKQADMPESINQTILSMQKEMQSMRQMMAAELGELSWRELGRHNPESKSLFRRLMTFGLSSHLARSLIENIGAVEDEDVAWQRAMDSLTAQVDTMDEALLEHGGVIALVGPTGVGKTTTIAKLAARFAMRHGNRHVALVTTDNFRIGAKDQLHTYGRILNVPVRTAHTPEELDTVLSALSDKRLVLIDTAGISRHDDHFESQKAILNGSNHPIQTFLTLSATSSEHSLLKAIKSFEDIRLRAIIMTKLDEVDSLGSAISAIIHAQLPLSYITNGQRVPEDLENADARELITRAEEMMESGEMTFDPAYLAQAYYGAQASV